MELPILNWGKSNLESETLKLTSNPIIQNLKSKLEHGLTAIASNGALLGATNYLAASA